MDFAAQNDFIRKKLSTYTKDKNLIDELAHVISIRVYKNKYINKDDKQFKKLLNRISKSVYIDFFRKTKTNKVRNTLYIKADSISDYNADDNILKKENDSLFKHIDLLPEKQKEVLILRYYCDLNYRNISKIMGIPKNTALSHLAYAKKKIRDSLTKNQKNEN